MTYLPTDVVRRVLPAILALLVGGCAAAAVGSAESRGQHTVILVSMDGFRRDYLERHAPPALLGLAREGVLADAMIPSFPTNTFPNHYTIVTGLRPENHGIVHNNMYDPVFNARFGLGNPGSLESRWWEGEPIWVTAEKQGVRAATFFWPGSDVEIGGVRPSRWMRYDGSVPYAARVDSILTWLSLPRAERPRLLTLYFDEPDYTGHDDGPNAPTIRGAILKSDSALARLVSGLESRGLYDSVNVIVVSDHGMAELSPERVIFLADLVDTATVDVVAVGGMFMGRSRTGDDAGLAAALRRSPRVQAWLRQDVPERLHYRNHRRITPVVALADEGWRVLPSRRSRLTAGGGHGYDNVLPSMHTIFVARGPAFRRGARIPRFSNVDVYSLLAYLLGVQPAPNDGSLESLREALTP